MLKVKHERDCDCVVAGFRWHKGGEGTAVGSLLLGLFDDAGALQHVGVCASFTQEKRRELVEFLAPYRENALAGHPWKEWAEPKRRRPGSAMPGGQSRWSQGKDLSWEPLRPELVVEVAYEHMQGTRFRHMAHFRRWRPDKKPADCTYAQLEVVPPQELMAIFARRQLTRSKADATRGGAAVQANARLFRGAYAVRCTKTGEVWVGSSMNLDATRNSTCVRACGTAATINKMLQAAWNAARRPGVQLRDPRDARPRRVAATRSWDLLKKAKGRWVEQFGAHALAVGRARARRATRGSDRRPGRAFPVAAGALPGRCRRLTRMRVQVDERPRMESTSTSSTARCAAASGCFAFQRSRPGSAASLSGELATMMSGIFSAAFAAALARDGATRGASPSILRKCGGQGASPSPCRLVARRELEQLFERARRLVHASVRIADRREARGHGRDGEVGRVAVGDLVPVERRRDARVGQRPHRIGGAGGAVLGVLVVVEEDAVALLLPPLRGGDRGRPPLDLARERQRRAAHFGERPARLDADD